MTQEVFLKAFAKPPAADAELKLRPWLYRVAANACFNQLRSRRRLAADAGEAIDALPDGVDGYQRAETVALVEATLAGLNDRYRTALVLKDLHGLPPAEIAEVLEVSRPAADVLVHRARAAFKTAFAKLGGSVPAPASLGLVLAPLAVPPSLVAAPPLPAPAVAGATPPTGSRSPTSPPPCPEAPGCSPRSARPRRQGGGRRRRRGRRHRRRRGGRATRGRRTDARRRSPRLGDSRRARLAQRSGGPRLPGAAHGTHRAPPGRATTARTTPTTPATTPATGTRRRTTRTPRTTRPRATTARPAAPPATRRARTAAAETGAATTAAETRAAMRAATDPLHTVSIPAG